MKTRGTVVPHAYDFEFSQYADHYKGLIKLQNWLREEVTML